jgi:tRNA A37 methylthiotransferase MiaB
MKPPKHFNTVHLISLGCAKNTVDSASMAELLRREGYRLTEHTRQAGVIIVNTCGFIGPARDESYQVLTDLAAHKRKGQLLIAAGCLTQRYGSEVAQRVPGIDGILGTRRWMDIVKVVGKLGRERGLQPVYHLPDEGPSPAPGWPISAEPDVPRLAVQGGSAYLKIADGCRRPCAFCAIPLIKGTATSRPMEAILNEVRWLASQGVREINLIAQDTTDYGYDLGLKDGLALLLEKMTDPELYGRGAPTPLIPLNPGPLRPPLFSPKNGARRGIETGNLGIWRSSAALNTQISDNLPLTHMGERENPAPTDLPWIRVMYAYPGYVTDRLIEVMATRPQIVHYLDMPLQHAHADTLRRMRRPANIDWVYNTVEKMRRQIPDLALRTTFIVGYPGETEAEFQTLLDFVRAMRFDRLGTFQFSFETGTPSEPLGDPIPPEVKEARYNQLMELQHNISLEINQTFIGKVLPVLIEGQEKPADTPSESPQKAGGSPASQRKADILIGRSYRDAPEIDGVVVVRSERGVVRSERGVEDVSSSDVNYSTSTDTKYCVSTDQSLIGEIVPVRITGAMAYDLYGILETRGGTNLDLPK